MPIEPETGLRIPSRFDAAIDGAFRGLDIQGNDLAQSGAHLQQYSVGAQTRRARTSSGAARPGSTSTHRDKLLGGV